MITLILSIIYINIYIYKIYKNDSLFVLYTDHFYIYNLFVNFIKVLFNIINN